MAGLNLAADMQTLLGGEPVLVLEETQKLVAPDDAPQDGLGWSVSIKADRLVAGAPGADGYYGAAYVYLLDGGGWALNDKLTTGRVWADGYGSVVSMGDNRALIAQANGNFPIRAPRMFVQDGSPVSCNTDAGCVDIGSGECVANFCAGTVWSSEAVLPAENIGPWYGKSLSVQGDLAVVGDPHGSVPPGPTAGKASIFWLDPAEGWRELDEFTSEDIAFGDAFGFGVAMSGDWIIAGAPDDSDAGSYSGSAYVFQRNDNNTPEDLADDFWEQRGDKLTAPDASQNDRFGIAVAIDGDIAVVGAHWNDDNGNNSGSAYAFRYDGSDWIPDGPKLLASDGGSVDSLGWSVAVSGNRILVGAYGADGMDPWPGAAYLYQRFDNSYACSSDQDCIDVGLESCIDDVCEDVVWAEVAKLIASDPDPEDLDKFLGYSVSISGDWAVLGAPRDNNRRGAAYVYDLFGIGTNCGNGKMDPGEECDDGAGNSDTAPDACRTDCTLPSCGDDVCDSNEDASNCVDDCASPEGDACNDGIDNDGDGAIDCEDPDCQPCCGDGNCDADENSCTCADDCGPPDATEEPGATCDDGLDNDCDTLTDCADPDCDSDPTCFGTIVSQAGDNDGYGFGNDVVPDGADLPTPIFNNWTESDPPYTDKDSNLDNGTNEMTVLQHTYILSSPIETASYEIDIAGYSGAPNSPTWVMKFDGVELVGALDNLSQGDLGSDVLVFDPLPPSILAELSDGAVQVLLFGEGVGGDAVAVDYGKLVIRTETVPDPEILIVQAGDNDGYGFGDDVVPDGADLPTLIFDNWTESDPPYTDRDSNLDDGTGVMTVLQHTYILTSPIVTASYEIDLAGYSGAPDSPTWVMKFDGVELVGALEGLSQGELGSDVLVFDPLPPSILAELSDGAVQVLLYGEGAGGETVAVDYARLVIQRASLGDLNGDGQVDAFDLAQLLGSWGACPDPDDCPADFDGDGDVDAADLAMLLGNWGP